MKTARGQIELPLRLSASRETIPINGRCTLRRQGSVCVVSVAGLPMHHWAAGDRLGESYAIVNLLQCGYARQTEIARAFGCTTRTIRSGFDILTYRKGKWPRIPRTRFATHTQRIEGRKISYELNDKPIRLLGRKLRLRQVTRLREEKHQTAVVTSRWDLSAVEVAYRMFERWRQENFFKYQREEYAIDALVDYSTEAEDPDRLVPNPERRKVEKQLTAACAQLRGLQAAYGNAVQGNRKTDRLSGRAELGRQTRQASQRAQTIRLRRDRLPKRIAVKALKGEPLVRLSRERKHLTNCLKMVAYQAESDLLALVRPHYARADQEGRTLIGSALQAAADVEVDEKKGELRVTLLPLSSPHRTAAIAAMCQELDSMRVRFPGSPLCMRFGVVHEAPKK
jgi:hypothetical protein